MPVPTYDRFIEPILRFLATHPEGAYAKNAHEAAADALGLTAADREEMLPSGIQAAYKNRAGWAHDRLKRAGLSSSPRRGFWRLTEAGMAFNAEHSGPLSDALREEVATANLTVRLRGHDETVPLSPPVVSTKEASLSSPDDRLGQALQELREAAELELLELLAGVSPTFFESIVLDLLHRMGYGTSRQDLQRVGGSGDGGIDGIISLDRLGLEKVYVQAKRWQSSVGRPELQAFYGALRDRRLARVSSSPRPASPRRLSNLRAPSRASCWSMGSAWLA